MARQPTTNSRPSRRSATAGAAKPRMTHVKVRKAKPPRVTRAIQLEAMLRRSKGATAAEVAATMKIQEHTARAMISIERRKQGWEVTLEARRYRIVR